MSLRSVCDAWIADLKAHVPELADATTHRYAQWSLELMGEATGTHVAVFPVPKASTVVPFATGNLPTDLETNVFRGVIWETALAEATRVFDDETANGDWLDLYEQVKARLRVEANTGLGTTAGYTRYTDWDAGIRGTVRYMEFGFTVRETASFT